MFPVPRAHKCCAGCEQNIKHVAQLAFIDLFSIVSCLEGDWDAIRAYIRGVVPASELQRRLKELHDDASRIVRLVSFQRESRKNLLVSAP